MARIRSIKPEFPQSETIGRLSRDARLLFIQLWTIVDDAGRARASSRVLASLLYPFDDDAKHLIDGWLHELAENDCLFFYTADDNKYLQITNWLKHQKIDRPSLSRVPSPDDGIRETLASPREPSMLDIGVGYRNKDISSSLRSEDMPREATPLAILSECLTEQTAKDLIAHRQAKRTKLTPRAARELVKAFRDYGDPEAAAAEMMLRGWTGFKPDWMRNARAGPSQKIDAITAAIMNLESSPNETQAARPYQALQSIPFDGEYVSGGLGVSDT